MNILLVNDDGVEAQGLRLLTEIMTAFGRVRIVAPYTQQSGIGHGITIHDPIRLRRHPDYAPGAEVWSLEAKPADCVKFALYALGLETDLVVSGINDGPNLGTDIMYSGTMSGASEGIICGIPSIAVSTDFGHWDLPRNELAPIVRAILRHDLLSRDHVLNLNFPRRVFSASKGIRVSDMGSRPFLHEFVESETPDVFWSRGTWDEPVNTETSDVWAYEHGYVALTPIQINRTSYTAMEALRSVLEGPLPE